MKLSFTDHAKFRLLERAISTEEIKETLLPQIPLGRFGLPQEVARAVLFLASPDSDYITGHVLHVDGGLAM